MYSHRIPVYQQILPAKIKVNTQLDLPPARLSASQFAVNGAFRVSRRLLGESQSSEEQGAEIYGDSAGVCDRPNPSLTLYTYQ